MARWLDAIKQWPQKVLESGCLWFLTPWKQFMAHACSFSGSQDPPLLSSSIPSVFHVVFLPPLLLPVSLYSEARLKNLSMRVRLGHHLTRARDFLAHG